MTGSEITSTLRTLELPGNKEFEEQMPGRPWGGDSLGARGPLQGAGCGHWLSTQAATVVGRTNSLVSHSGPLCPQGVAHHRVIEETLRGIFSLREARGSPRKVRPNLVLAQTKS